MVPARSATLRHADPERDAAAFAAMYAPYVEGSATSFDEVAPDAAQFRSLIERTTRRYPWLVLENAGAEGRLARNDDMLDASRHSLRAMGSWRSLRRGSMASWRWQLRELGLSAGTVRSRVSSGRLHRGHAGVFAVEHARVTRNAWYMAAVLACGEDAVLSHRSCAALRGLRADARNVVDVISRSRRAPSSRSACSRCVARTAC